MGQPQMDEEVKVNIIITAEMNGEKVTRSLSADLEVAEEHINLYLIDAPGKTAYWNYLFQQQKTKVQKKQVVLKRKEAELDKHIRGLRLADDMKVNNVEIAALIATDAEYQKIEDELLDMQETLNLLKGATEAIHEMRSTLISLSANMRTEFKPTRTRYPDNNDNNGNNADRLKQLMGKKDK